jgi:hypothetical protein
MMGKLLRQKQVLSLGQHLLSISAFSLQPLERGTQRIDQNNQSNHHNKTE